MATTDRQNSLLVSQDWQKIYRSFQQSDFLSYDFDTIRRTMIQYLQNNYPEDFNDAPCGDRSKLLNYFIHNRLKELTESIGDF